MPDVVLIGFAVAAAVAFLIGALVILEGDARDVEPLELEAADDSGGRHERRTRRVWRPALHRAAVAIVDGLIGAVLALLFLLGADVCIPRLW